MPSELFRQVFLLLIGLIVGATLVSFFNTQTDLMVSWCLILTAHRDSYQRQREELVAVNVFR